MSSDQDVGAALLLTAVGSPGEVDPLGAGEVVVPVGGVAVDAGAGAVDPAGPLLVLVGAVDDAAGVLLRAREVDVGAVGAGWTTPPAGFAVCGVVGCTPR